MSNKKMRGAYVSQQSSKGKVCSFCGKELPLDCFALNGKDADGNARRRDDCKTCYNIRRKENAAKKRHTDFLGSMKRRGESEVSYSHQQWKETVIFFGGECAYCGRTMRRGEHLTRDHLEPVKEGGTTTQDNIIPACRSCNSAKGATEWREWFMQQPFFSQERMNRIFKWRSIIRSMEGED